MADKPPTSHNKASKASWHKLNVRKLPTSALMTHIVQDYAIHEKFTCLFTVHKAINPFQVVRVALDVAC